MSGQGRVVNEWVPKRNIFFVFMGLWAGIAWAYNKTTSSLLFSIEIEKWAQNTSACENRNTQGGWQTKPKLCSMWLFRPVMNSSARNDRMAVLRNSFNSASLRANVFFFVVAFKRTDDVLNGRQLLLIITFFFYRYTSLVDRYVPNIAACLKDGTSLVRRQTLTLLTHLLQVSKSTHEPLAMFTLASVYLYLV